MSYIIVGIHTGIGKTISSAVLVESLEYDYWKPIQAGELKHTDSMVIEKLISNTKSVIHPEIFRLKTATSPHYAAKIENKLINLSDLHLPKSTNPILIETAGGLLSPISDTFSNLDIIKHFKLPVILVTQDYLGSINHTMLTYETLSYHKIKIKGLIFCGNEFNSTREYILKNTELPSVSIPHFDKISKKFIYIFACQIKNKITEMLNV